MKTKMAKRKRCNIYKAQKMREELEKANSEIEQAERNYDLNKSSRIKIWKNCQSFKEQLKVQEELAAKSRESSLLRTKVTEEEITRIISKMDWNTSFKIS